MKKSNQFLATFGLVILLMMLYTDLNLAQEFKKIDLTDPFKNYISLPVDAYSVVHLSGSNGYPIEIVHSEKNDLKALRSRTGHIKYKVIADTLFLEYTGTNITMEQSRHTKTPPAVIIQSITLPEIIAVDVHCTISDFNTDDAKLTASGHAYIEIANSQTSVLRAALSHEAHLDFLDQNSIDSLHLSMTNTSIAFLKNVNLHHIEQVLGDSVSIVLSNNVFSDLIQ